ncbi:MULTISPECIES: hypothetical protein [Acinetobacter]|jgi:uncharacterized protein YbaR (Trm112 family)|uniref:hypothetical protein n=1 Tax=Acinetobacter TaxID=469 RepID=UPI000B3C5CF2|nr:MULTISPECIES: hypothetical protein [Acinetobacter]AXY59841.1 hypothetical protein CDG61_07240 [Acinetobacter sp. WCHAc010052]WOE42874.1 hypothetical protein QSG87_07050 [Acinetobacter chinensis]
MLPLHILQKQLDESAFCPLCKGSMYWIEAEQYDRELNFHECSYCEHRIYADQKQSCHCESCEKNKRKLIKEALSKESYNLKNKGKDKDMVEHKLNQLSFIQKLFLLSILDDQVSESSHHHEYIDWEKIKYVPFSPNYQYQKRLINQMLDQQILISRDSADTAGQYYINVRLDGYSEPSLYSITFRLRQWFYENLSQGIPFKSADEVKDAIYELLYEKIVQFMQYYCRLWQVQISGNNSFKALCYRLLDSLACGQIFYLVQTALDYLHSKKLLQLRNEKFINTNLLKKTVEQYRERGLQEKWVTTTLPHPPQLPFSGMAEILFFRFLGYDEMIFVQPVWKIWEKIEPRLKFYALKRCMHCGSDELDIEYDAHNHISLFCRTCKQQDHYFTR